MKALKTIALASLLVVVPACGQIVEFKKDGGPAGHSGIGGKSGSGGNSGTAGRSGSGGAAGNDDTDAGSIGGNGGNGGSGGSGGKSGTAGAAGSAGKSGAGGNSGSAGASGLGGDSVAPTVASTTPAPDALNVAINTTVSATFSEGMNPTTVSAATFTVMQAATPVVGVVTLVGNVATFTPDSALANGTSYTAKISTGAKDLAGNALASDYVWMFTTLDNTPPSVVTTNPADADMQAPLNKIVTAKFSETVKTLTVNATTFTVTGPGLTPVLGAVAYDPVTNVASFVPSSNLAPNTTYTATITTGVMDLAGNAPVGDHVWTFITGNALAQTVMQLALPLGAASTFAILASAAITDIPTSMITGDVGLSPDSGANVSGFSAPATCPEVVGKIYVIDATGPACATIDPTLLTNAKLAAQVAYANAIASVRGTPQAISGDLNGLTLYPGLYESGSSLQISAGGFLYLDAQGDSNAVFIIRSATSITTLDTSAVVLTKGAKAANIYWTAGSAITLGTHSIMKGTMIAGTALSLLTGANLEGRALNQGPAAAAVTLDSNTITVPSP